MHWIVYIFNYYYYASGFSIPKSNTARSTRASNFYFCFDSTHYDSAFSQAYMYINSDAYMNISRV